MEKAFDLKALEEKLKASGLPVVESLAESVASAVLEWVKESAMLEVASGKALFALVPPVVEAIKPVIKEQLDKIDGQAG